MSRSAAAASRERRRAQAQGRKAQPHTSQNVQRSPRAPCRGCLSVRRRSFPTQTREHRELVRCSRHRCRCARVGGALFARWLVVRLCRRRRNTAPDLHLTPPRIQIPRNVAAHTLRDAPNANQPPLKRIVAALAARQQSPGRLRGGGSRRVQSRFQVVPRGSGPALPAITRLLRGAGRSAATS